jgi:hypothetical protein
MTADSVFVQDAIPKLAKAVKDRDFVAIDALIKDARESLEPAQFVEIFTDSINNLESHHRQWFKSAYGEWQVSDSDFAPPEIEQVYFKG